MFGDFVGGPLGNAQIDLECVDDRVQDGLLVHGLSAELEGGAVLAVYMGKNARSVPAPVLDIGPGGFGHQSDSGTTL